MSEKSKVKKKTKEDYIEDYIRGFDAIEKVIEPYKEQRRALRESFQENDWLSKEEMRTAVRAYRMMKSEVDFDELTKCYETIKKSRKL